MDTQNYSVMSQDQQTTPLSSQNVSQMQDYYPHNGTTNFPVQPPLGSNIAQAYWGGVHQVTALPQQITSQSGIEHGHLGAAAVTPPMAATQILSAIRERSHVLLPRQTEVDGVVETLCAKHPHPEVHYPKSQIVNPHKDSVIVEGMGGMGKTTLAAMIVSNVEVMSYFTDGIGWINLGLRREEGTTNSSGTGGGSRFTHQDYASPLYVSTQQDEHQMSYETYRSHLEDLCRQLNLQPPPQFDELVFLPGDDEVARSQKRQMAMESMLQTMCNFLSLKRVLIVLDDVWHVEDVSLFSFANRINGMCRVLVTTRTRLRRDDMHRINLRSLGEDEAVNLLLTESGLVEQLMSSKSGQISGQVEHPDAKREEALRVVMGCGCHPMAIRVAGRLVASRRLNGDPMNLSELADSIEAKGVVATANPEQTLFDMLDQSFDDTAHGLVIARLLKRCFSSFAAVFTREDCGRPWISFRFVHLLWNDLLTDEERRVIEVPGKSATALLLERMELLGMIDSTTEVMRTGEGHSKMQRFCRVHHDILHQYGVQNLLRWKTARNIFSSKIAGKAGGATSLWMGRKFGAKKLSVILNDSFINSYLYQCQNGTKTSCDLRLHNWTTTTTATTTTQGGSGKSVGVNRDDESYAFAYLPLHMLKANQMKKAEETLANKSFVECRLSVLGILDGTKAHVADIEMLNRSLDHNRGRKKWKNTDGSTTKKHIMDLCFESITVCLREQQRQRQQQQPNNTDTPESRNEEIGEAFLVLGKALQSVSQYIDSLDMLSEALDSFRGELAENHPTVGVIKEHIAAISLQELAWKPRDSINCFKFKHVDALRSMQGLADDGERHRDPEFGESSELSELMSVPLELSSHPGLAVVPCGTKFHNAVFISVLTLGIGPKDGAVRVKWDGDGFVRDSDGAVLATKENVKEGDPIVLRKKNCRVTSMFPSKFVVNQDGTMSPHERPHLALGFDSQPLLLVRRDSPARLIFKQAEDLRHHPVEDLTHDALSRVENVFSTELLSHPGQAVVKLNHHTFRSLSVFQIGIGPIDDAFRIGYNGRSLADSDSGYVLKIVTSKYTIGRRVLLFSTRRKSDMIIRGGGNDFVINADGSISPMHCPNVAIGALCLSVTNTILSPDDKTRAQREAKLMPPTIPRTVLLREQMALLRSIASKR